MTKFLRLLPGVACVILAGPAWAGFDFVTPEVQSTAPVAAVEQAELPPPSGVPVSEIAPVVAPAPVANGAPLSIAEPDDMATGSAYAQAPVVNAAPVVEPAPTPVVIPRGQNARNVTVPQSIYPPVDNRAAHPLVGSRPVEIAPKPVPARVIPPRMDPLPVDAPAPVVATQPARSALVSTVPVVAPAPVPVSNAPLATIDGFGTNIPLSLAMEQVVPAGFTVNDQVHVNQDTIVSWVGGRPWNKVLEDMLYAHGVRVSVAGKTVTLYAPGVAVAPAQPTTPPTAPEIVVGTPAPVIAAPAPIQAPAPLPTREVQDLTAVPAMPPGAGPAPVRTTAPVVTAVPEVADLPIAYPPVAQGIYDPSRVDIFSARTGESVKDVLLRWGRIAHIQVIWQMDNNDLVLPRSFAVNAPFPRALERFFDIYRGGSLTPSAVITAGPDATAVIRPAQKTPGFTLD